MRVLCDRTSEGVPPLPRDFDVNGGHEFDPGETIQGRPAEAIGWRTQRPPFSIASNEKKWISQILDFGRFGRSDLLEAVRWHCRPG